MNSILSFNDICLLEALVRSSFQNGRLDKHYDDRVKDRILNLKISAVTDESKKKVTISPEKIAKAEEFYSKCLKFLSDPDGAFLKGITVNGDRFGRVKLGTLLMAEDGKTLYPLFRSYNKGKGDTIVYDNDQRAYWIYTVGPFLKTVIAQKFDDIDTSYFAAKEMKHTYAEIRKGLESEDPEKKKIANARQDVIDGLSNETGFDLSPGKIGEWIKAFTVIDPNIDIMFDTALPVADQFKKFAISIDPSYGQAPQSAGANVIMSNRELTSNTPLEVAQDKTEISLTPDKTWFMTYNDKNEVWGAQPILGARAIPSKTVGNAIMLSLGLKWLYWVDTPMYNVKNAQELGTFTPFSNTIDKGDLITIGRQNPDGSWTVRQGKIKTVSNSDSSHKFPYIGLEGAAKTFTISMKDGEKIFVPFIPNRIGESLVLTFSRWLDLRS